MRSPSTGRVGVPFSARSHSARSGRNPDGELVEGLRMRRRAAARPAATAVRVAGPGEEGAPAFSHQPVMAAEVARLMADSPPGWVLDATVGGGGHAKAILEAAPHLSVLGIDRDPSAVSASRRSLRRYGARARLRRARFDALTEVIASAGLRALSGVLFDLGVSSPQLDLAGRGFSYRVEGPLDMRMDPDEQVTASDVVNEWGEQDLSSLLAANGESRFARRIARAVIAARPITTTTELAGVVRDAIPAAARRSGGHPARRVFQAVRIAVNAELDVLPGGLAAALDSLVPGGRCVVLAYHSGEDRIVKALFRAAASGGCTCPPGLPCACGAEPKVKLLTRSAVRPRADEVASNRRAQSARLRAVERLGSEPGAGAEPIRPEGGR